VLTYCLMSNHFHLLLEVPKRPDPLPSAEQILAKLERLSGHQNVGAAREQLAGFRQGNEAEGERRWLEGYDARMLDLSAFIKLLKQRFTQWYNRRTGRQGTLREDRSVVGCGISAMGRCWAAGSLSRTCFGRVAICWAPSARTALDG
jgi:REP element-mobilizing transposase RayT